MKHTCSVLPLLEPGVLCSEMAVEAAEARLERVPAWDHGCMGRMRAWGTWDTWGT